MRALAEADALLPCEEIASLVTHHTREKKGERGTKGARAD